MIKNLLNEVLTLMMVFFVLAAYLKVADYYDETIVEPKIGMKCGDGNPIETWRETETIFIPTHDCTTLDHHLDYFRWFVIKVIELIMESIKWLILSLTK